MKNSFAFTTAALYALLIVSNAFASEIKQESKPDLVCDINAGDSALLKCYQNEYQRKSQNNDDRTRGLIERSKEQLQAANESSSKHQAEAVAELVRKISKTVLSTRRSAAQECVRMAAKFQNQSTSIVAAVNCRTGHEVRLDKQLRQLELQLEVLSIEPQ